jgi:hypothetical protein
VLNLNILPTGSGKKTEILSYGQDEGTKDDNERTHGAMEKKIKGDNSDQSVKIKFEK